MSVRRLADENVQPEAFAFTRAYAAEAKTWVKKYPRGRQQSAVIPLLMLAQEQDGWVTRAAIEYIADMLDMPYIRALEVATFYTQFQLKPVGTRAHVQVCGTTPCMLRGSEELIEVCRKKIHPEPLHTNEAGTLSWEEVECQGACVNAPMVMIFKDAYEDLTAERLAAIIDSFEAGRGGEIRPGPQIDRIYSAPATGLTTLTTDPTIDRTRAEKVKAAPKIEAPVPKPERTGQPKPQDGEGEMLTTSRPAAPVDVDEVSRARATGGKAAARKTASRLRRSADEEAAAAPEGTGDAAHVGMPSGEASNEPPAETATPSLDDVNRPAGIERPAAPDDLKLISGVGPKIERVLNELGIYTYGQVAGWSREEREWIDGYLRFRGRIERDDWVRQAEALAKGGRDEYVRVFGREPR